jgi:hypothetical protein
VAAAAQLAVACAAPDRPHPPSNFNNCSRTRHWVDGTPTRTWPKTRTISTTPNPIC